MPTFSGTADGVIDRVIGATDLVHVAHGLAQLVAVDATGAPVVFLQGSGSDSVLARVATDQGWTKVAVPAALCAAATVFVGVIPSPLVDWANHAGASLGRFI